MIWTHRTWLNFEYVKKKRSEDLVESRRSKNLIRTSSAPRLYYVNEAHSPYTVYVTSLLCQYRPFWESFAFRSQCVLATSTEFSPRPFHASAMTMVRSCHVVEDSNKITRSFGSLHVCSTFSPRLCHVQRIQYKYGIHFLTSSLVFQLRREHESGTSATCSASRTSRSTWCTSCTCFFFHGLFLNPSGHNFILLVCSLEGWLDKQSKSVLKMTTPMLVLRFYSALQILLAS